MIDIDKTASRFQKAHQSYAQHAIVQRDICQTLMAAMSKVCAVRHFEQVLEIGCGCGFLTQEFFAHFGAKTLYLNDLYPQAMHQSVPDEVKVHHLVGDIRTQSLPDSLQLVMSSSALQWVYPLQKMFVKLSDALLSGGLLAISVFGQNNLWQIRHLTGQGLDYHTLDELVDFCAWAGFALKWIHQESRTLYFDTPKAVLRHLQATGVTSTSQDFRWNKQSLMAFEQNYEAWASTQGVPLTYDPIYLIAQKL
ncbi:malonyl-ACP O-methyltransferase BioC [Moraxella sp.]|uniref:malonyl-ACP O-methyltransferase BioC n=1 Tax=Moraxella sp. TaxID=479 RepID=UPI0026DA97C3|nr:malonyl-ACP O-methyltransferase BioC [Moraxella sp.]MDO4894645.1 malonyl-ACP O-methyltransferase BioC [Moraxella sp.]